MKTNSRKRDSHKARVSVRRARIKKISAQTPSARRITTQTLLLDAGRDLIISKGLGSTSVGDICTAAGFSRGAFYSNFTDMDHFVTRLAQEQWNAVVHYVDSAVTHVLSTHEHGLTLTDEEITTGINHLAEDILHAMPVGRDFYMLQSEFTARIARDPEHSTALREGYEAFTASLTKVLTSGLAAIGRRPVLAGCDAGEIILATAERSMRQALIHGDEDGLTELLTRTLPTLLTRLSVPIDSANSSAHTTPANPENPDSTR